MQAILVADPSGSLLLFTCVFFLMGFHVYIISGEQTYDECMS